MRLVSLVSLGLCIICVAYILAEKKVTKRSITMSNSRDQRNYFDRDLRMTIRELNSILARKSTKDYGKLIEKYDKKLKTMFDDNNLLIERSMRFLWYRAQAILDRIERRYRDKPDSRPYYIPAEFYYENINELLVEMESLIPEIEEKSVKVLMPRLRKVGSSGKLLRALWFLDKDQRKTKDPELEALFEKLTKITMEIRKVYENDELVRQWFNAPMTNGPVDDDLDASRELKGEELDIFIKQLPEMDKKVFDKVGGFGKMVVLLLDGDCMVYAQERKDYLITYTCHDLVD